MWPLIFSLLIVCLTLFQQTFVQISFAQLKILSVTSSVAAGGGNKNAPLDHFSPENLEIQVNETVEWNNPTIGVAYPHTVSFIRAGNISIVEGIPLNVSHSSSFDTLSLLRIIQNNFQNRTASNQNDTFLHDTILNTSALIYPSIINTTTNGVFYINPASNFNHDGAYYIMSGTEKYLNSGLIFPDDNIPRNFPEISKFTVKFSKTGEYHYQCLIHTEMQGTISVTQSNMVH